MWKRWRNKKVSLDILARHIVDFFSKKGFDVKSSKANGGIVYLARLADQHVEVVIKIVGDKNDFKIEFAAKQTRFLTFFGNLLTMIGGGSLVLRNAQTLVSLDRLESDFWLFIENVVNDLSVC